MVPVAAATVAADIAVEAEGGKVEDVAVGCTAFIVEADEEDLMITSSSRIDRLELLPAPARPCVCCGCG